MNTRAVALLKKHLASNKEAGQKTVRLSPEGKAALQSLASAASGKGPARTQPPAQPAKKETAEPKSVRAAAPTSAAAPGWRPQVPRGSKAAMLDALRAQALECRRCPHLADFRTQVVFGVGNPEARLMFVGEAPGADEDEQGMPFVGRAGNMLTKMLEAMGLTRDQIYIANVLKCRPDIPAGTPGNRKPTAAEMGVCTPFLVAQIEIIQPTVMVALGATAVLGLLNDSTAIGLVRGRWREYQGIPLMPTYHPSYLLHNSNITEKRKVWEDLMKVMERMGMPISAKQRGFFLKA